MLALYWQTAASIVAIWIRSETFAHGFVVIPICFWLVWRASGDAGADSMQGRGGRRLSGVLLAGALWLVASAADALGVRQFALAFMIQAGIVAVVGKRLRVRWSFRSHSCSSRCRQARYSFPTLIDRTADFTVAALRWSGVPVYREANHFLIPSGAWSVVEACSGIRYIIASLMVGTIYAAVAYRSPRRRVAVHRGVDHCPDRRQLVAGLHDRHARPSDQQQAGGRRRSYHLRLGILRRGDAAAVLGRVVLAGRDAIADSCPSAIRAAQAGSLRTSARACSRAAIAAIMLAAIWLPIEAVRRRGPRARRYPRCER